eukprot:61817-Prorocentrum_minimum.AAC.1
MITSGAQYARDAILELHATTADWKRQYNYIFEVTAHLLTSTVRPTMSPYPTLFITKGRDDPYVIVLNKVIQVIPSIPVEYSTISPA